MKAGGADSPNKINSSEEYNCCIIPELQTSTEIKIKEKEKRQRDENNGERPSKRWRGEGTPSSLKRGVQGGLNPANTPAPRPPKPDPTTASTDVEKGHINKPYVKQNKKLISLENYHKTEKTHAEKR